MPYCVLADIQAEIPALELIQLTDDNVPLVVTAEMLATAVAGGDVSGFPEAAQNATAAVLAVITKAISDAGDVIDGYVGSRYQLPLTAVPALVKTIAVDIAVYRLYLRRKKKEVAAGIQAAYDNSMKLLRDIQAGKVSIGATAAGQAVPTVATGAAQITSSPRIFTRDSMKGF